MVFLVVTVAGRRSLLKPRLMCLAFSSKRPDRTGHNRQGWRRPGPRPLFAAVLVLTTSLLLGAQTGARATASTATKSQERSGPHPLAQYLVRPAGVPINELRPTRNTTDSLLARSIHDARELVSLGTGEYGDVDYTFGVILDVVVDSHDRIYVLDERFNNVRVFSPEGKLLQTLGRSGPGPGEFSAVESMAIYESLLYVADRARELEVFSIEDITIRHVDTIRISTVIPESICVTSSEVIIAGGSFTTDGNFVKIFAHDGSLRRSFGDTYKSPNPAVNRAFNQNLIICDPAGKYILVGLRDLGEVKAYDFEGRPLWIAASPLFLNSGYIYGIDGVIAQISHPESAYRLESLARVSAAHALVQIAHYDAPEDEIPTRTQLQTYVISPSKGRVDYLGEELPLIVSLSARWMITVEGIEYPRLRVYQLSGSAM